jgi:sugar phosphate isomerase/epimerase
MSRHPISVFTKPWTEPLPSMAEKVAALGLDGVELPVRPGYQVTPENAAAGLADATRVLGAQGLKITSVASTADETIIAACGENSIPLIRIMAPIDLSIGYVRSIEGYRRHFDALLPALDRHRVTIGVQNHYGNFVGSAVGLLHLIEKYEPRLVCAVLDMAHCAVDGEPTAMAVDIVKDKLHHQVNFKSAYHWRANGPEDEALYKVKWTTHQHGGYSWRELVDCLKKVGFAGTLCLPAEYSDPAGKPQRMGDDVIPYLKEDLAHLRSIVADW